jgi:hypothetical protein
LVGGGFEQAMPRFFFPDQSEQDLVGPAGSLRAADAARQILLIDVPVIPLRRWFEELLHTKPPSYDVLLSQGSAALQSALSADLRCELGPVVLPPGVKPRHFVIVNGTRLGLSSDQFAYLRFFAERLAGRARPFDNALDIVEEMGAWLGKIREKEPRFYHMSEAFEAGTFTGDSLARRLSDLRKFLSGSGDSGRRLASVLPGKGHWALRLPPEAVILHD